MENNNNLNVPKAFLALLVFVLVFLGLRAFVVDSILEDTNTKNTNNNEYKGEAFRLVEKQTQKHDRRVELGMEWFRTHSGGGNRCALDKKGACGETRDVREERVRVRSFVRREKLRRTHRFTGSVRGWRGCG